MHKQFKTACIRERMTSSAVNNNPIGKAVTVMGNACNMGVNLDVIRRITIFARKV